MSTSFSVADARSQLPAILRAVERGERVPITRRGRMVAVVVPVEDYDRLESKPALTFLERWSRWREGCGAADLGLDEAFFEDLRDRSPERDVVL